MINPCKYNYEIANVYFSESNQYKRINQIHQSEYMQPLDVPNGFLNQPKPLSKKQKAKLKKCKQQSK